MEKVIVAGNQGSALKGQYLFVVLTYNHQAYIIEHLESIRYQIEKWGTDKHCAILVADDCSHDATVSLAREWLKSQTNILYAYDILESKKNNGTCQNFVRVFPYIRGRCFKVVAGDDMYSSENIFELMDTAKPGVVTSGLPILLFPKGFSISRSLIFNMVSSAIIYRKDFMGAMKGFSSIHTPSIAYDESMLSLPGMADFITSFMVVEDFAMQIRMAELLPEMQYKLKEKFYIYYRRTDQSTFIVKNNAFLRDKVRLYRYLANRESNPFVQCLIRNRILCLNMRGMLKYLANINTYIYLFRVMLRFPQVLRGMSNITCPMEKYRDHLLQIKKNARIFSGKNSQAEF